MSLYLLLTAGLYTALRLALRVRAEGLPRPLLDGLVALAMVALGTGLAAIQLVPFAEVIGANVRTGWADYEETVGYAMPKERLLAYLLPNLFGNPTHHGYYDLIDRRDALHRAHPPERRAPHGHRVGRQELRRGHGLPGRSCRCCWRPWRCSLGRAAGRWFWPLSGWSRCCWRSGRRSTRCCSTGFRA